MAPKLELSDAASTGTYFSSRQMRSPAAGVGEATQPAAISISSAPVRQNLAEVIANFENASEYGEGYLEIRRGECVEIIHHADEDADWWYVSKCADPPSEGWVPATFLKTPPGWVPAGSHARTQEIPVSPKDATPQWV